MVGVPGRSKGCHTCRRRKIKCDLGQPSCQKCVKSNRPCEGYSKLPVFLNRTVQGMARRGALEEAVIDVQVELPKTSPASKAVAAYISAPMNNSLAYVWKLEGEFCQIYVPSNVAPGANPPGAYVASIVSDMTPAQRGIALDCAARALWTSRLGRVYNDQSLVHQGELAYGAALQHLQAALYDNETAAKDKTLAAASMLSLYELYESTVRSIKGHDNHIKGLIRLITWRGKADVTKRPLGRHLLEVSRWNAMVHSIQYRQHSILGEPEWRCNSWNTIVDFEQQLYDRGLDIGELLKDIDAFSNFVEGNKTKQSKTPSPSPQSMGVIQDIIKRSAELDKSLEEWYERLRDWSIGPVYWEESPRPGCNSTEPQRIINFANLRMCHLMLDFWALHMIISSIMTTLFEKLPPHVQSLEHLRPFAERVESHGLHFMFELGTIIADAALYSLRPDMGMCGPQHSIFGVRVALFTFRIKPGDYAMRQRARCEALLHRLANENGLQFARDLSKVSGDWKDTLETNDVESRSQASYRNVSICVEKIVNSGYEQPANSRVSE